MGAAEESGKAGDAGRDPAEEGVGAEPGQRSQERDLPPELRVVTDWTVSLFFPRDIAELSMLGHARGLSWEGREVASTISVTPSTRGGEGVD